MRVFLTILTCLFTVQLLAQDALVLKYENRTKRFRYHRGMEMHVKLENGTKVRGSIYKFISDSTLVIGDTILDINSIEKVYVSDGFKGNGALSTIAMFGAVLYPAIITTNGLINNDSPIVHKSVYPVTGSFLAFYFLRKYLFKRTFVVKDGKSSISIVRFLPDQKRVYTE